MSAVGTPLLQSPGCNEGKARYETLGIHERKVISSSVGAALTASVWFVSLRFVALHSLGKCRPFGAQDMLIDYKPRACALGYAGVSPLQGSSSSSLSLCYFDALALQKRRGCAKVRFGAAPR